MKHTRKIAIVGAGHVFKEIMQIAIIVILSLSLPEKIENMDRYVWILQRIMHLLWKM